MNKQEYIDDNTLSAFVDDELDNATSETVLNAMDTDIEVRERVYQLRRAKDMMHLAYVNATAPGNRSAQQQQSRKLSRYGSLAASLFALVLSFLVGMGSYHYLVINTRTTAPVYQANHSNNIVLHVSEADQSQYLAMLNYVDTFLKQHEDESGQIDVVAHADGIELVRQDTSPYRDRVISLMENHSNVHFVACASGLKLLRSRGVEPRIIRGVATDTTAMDHIIARVQAGWSYIKVSPDLSI